MDIQKIKKEFKKAANKKEAEKMSAYMQNIFKFYGIKAPERREILKPFWGKVSEPIDWKFVFACWEEPEREMQYTAMDYLHRKMKQFTRIHITMLKQLALDKSWWDTVDGIDGFIGSIVQKEEDLKMLMLEWGLNDNFWIRRIAIQHQLEFKDKTDTEVLAKIIRFNFGQKEFFINKAIGWALREYSKTNPEWVRQFISENKAQLANLSIREGSKYI